MTPTQSYAQKRAEAESLIRQHAPARLQEPLIALLRPAIALEATRADDAQIPLGASKFGGAPDVPDGFEWPLWNGEPLGFLAQINLEEVAPFDVEGVLPRSGLLSFFYDVEQRTWGRAEERDGWRVFFFERITLERREVVQALAARLSFAATPTTPTDFECFPELGITTDDCIESGDWTQDGDLKKFIPALRHQMLGHSTAVQRNPGAEVEAAWRDFHTPGALYDWSEVETEADKWVLLLQMDSEDKMGTMWGDCGMIYFLMRPEDLAAREWSNVWFSLQCT